MKIHVSPYQSFSFNEVSNGQSASHVILVNQGGFYKQALFPNTPSGLFFGLCIQTAHIPFGAMYSGHLFLVATLTSASLKSLILTFGGLTMLSRLALCRFSEKG